MRVQRADPAPPSPDATLSPYAHIGFLFWFTGIADHGTVRDGTRVVKDATSHKPHGSDVVFPDTDLVAIDSQQVIPGPPADCLLVQNTNSTHEVTQGGRHRTPINRAAVQCSTATTNTTAPPYRISPLNNSFFNTFDEYAQAQQWHLGHPKKFRQNSAQRRERFCNLVASSRTKTQVYVALVLSAWPRCE